MVPHHIAQSAQSKTAASATTSQNVNIDRLHESPQLSACATSSMQQAMSFSPVLDNGAPSHCPISSIKNFGICYAWSKCEY
jgi:hypothetical protein